MIGEGGGPPLFFAGRAMHPGVHSAMKKGTPLGARYKMNL